MFDNQYRRLIGCNSRHRPRRLNVATLQDHELHSTERSLYYIAASETKVTLELSTEAVNATFLITRVIA